jgi:hypothetical protein
MERTVLVDDFDGTVHEGVQKHPVTLGNEVIGSVDLTDVNLELFREELRRAVERFVTQARPRTEREAADARVAAKLAATPTPPSATAVKTVGGKSHLSKRQRAEREQLNAIREWARKRGYEVSPYGKIPEAVMEAFQRLHGTPQEGARLKAVTKTTNGEGVGAESLFSSATA